MTDGRTVVLRHRHELIRQEVNDLPIPRPARKHLRICWKKNHFVDTGLVLCSAETGYNIKPHTFPAGIHDANRPRCPQV